MHQFHLAATAAATHLDGTDGNGQFTRLAKHMLSGCVLKRVSLLLRGATAFTLTERREDGEEIPLLAESGLSVTTYDLSDVEIVVGRGSILKLSTSGGALTPGQKIKATLYVDGLPSE